jgi:Domain of unknown function (DUF5666)
MRNHGPLQLTLSRRNWLLLSGAALSACGGGSSTAALPGTGGTGISVQGPISGFGSVIINATTFDDRGAPVLINGVSSLSSDLRIGMVARLAGDLATGSRNGRASGIEVWSIAQGVLTQTSANGFVVAGMPVQTDTSTAFDGIANAAALRSGLCVEVWGLPLSADASSWKACRVALLAAPDALNTLVSSGLAHVAGNQTTLNGLTLVGAAATGLQDLQLLRVEGTPTGSNVLQVARVTPLLASTSGPLSALVEVDGIVTAIASPTRFTLGTSTVDTRSASFSPQSADSTSLVVGGSVEVTGSWQAGVLQATLVEVKDATAGTAIEITGVVDSYVSAAQFTLRGQRCDAGSATLAGGVLGSLRAGMKVQAKGLSSGDETLLLTELYLNVP